MAGWPTVLGELFGFATNAAEQTQSEAARHAAIDLDKKTDVCIL